MTIAPHIQNVLSRLRGVKPHGERWEALCPAHDDQNPSLSVGLGDDGRVLVKCFAGCETEAVVRAMGMTMADLFVPANNGHQKGNGQLGHIVATYDYRDERGTMLYQVVRFSPKDFRQRRPDNNGGWIWSLAKTRRVLYRLPELLASDSQAWVFVAEGEKDADRLRSLGLASVCNVGGAGKWRREYNEFLCGRRVCIPPHNDDPGRGHGTQVARSLHGVAREVCIVELPGLPEHGDVSDWLAAGGTAEKLMELVDAAPVWVPSPRPETGAGNDHDLPTINAGERELKIITPLAWDALIRSNKPERLFRHGGVPSRIESDDDGGPIVRPLTKERTRYELARAANWPLTIEKGDSVSTRMVQPPALVVEDLLATPDPPLPVLQRIVEAPVFSPTGILQTSPGYHPASCTYLMGNLDIGAIPAKPTKADIQRARDLFLELMGEFPFVSEADRAHAIALGLLPYVRDMIDGPTPLHLFEAPEAGTGKGLLADALLRPAVGRHVSLMAEARDDDEWRKRITAKLREGRAALVIDNISRPLDSGVLSAALTATSWEDRILGKSETVRVPVRCVWVATGNNSVLTTEIARRCIRIRLDAKQDRPWTRAGFRIDNLRQWADDHRADLVRAALVLIQAWIASGCPRHEKRLGSFESWSEVVGGILDVAEVPGFLANLDQFYEQTDREGAVWREFIQRWWKQFADKPVGTKELFPLAQELDGFDLGTGHERSQKTVFGRKLGKQRDRVIGDYRVVSAGIAHSSGRWQLQPKGDMGDIGERFDPLPHARDDESDGTIRDSVGEREMFPNVPHVPPDDEDYERQERAAIIEFDGGMPLADAEAITDRGGMRAGSGGRLAGFR